MTNVSASGAVRVGVVILPQTPWPEAARQWALAEELGFDHAWTYDHLSWRTLADQPWGATIPTLTAAAMSTTRIRLGTFVASPNFRHPVPFAKDLATLDEISGGRLTLGARIGRTGFDSVVLGQETLSAKERHARFVEFVDGLDRLLRFEDDGESGSGSASASDSTETSTGISFEGDWYTARSARMVGRPAQSPRMPFALAANGPRGLDLVVRHGADWITTGRTEVATPDDLEGWWEGVATLSGMLTERLERAGSDPAGVARYLSLDSPGAYSMASVDAFEAATERAVALGFTDLVAHWPRAEGLYAGSEDVLREIAAARIR